MAYGRDLTRLRLAAVEGTAEHVGRRSPYRTHRTPGFRRRRLVGHVLEHPRQLPVADAIEPLPSELVVVPLHVDRPGLVTDDVNAVVDTSDKAVEIRSVRDGLQ